MITWRRHIHQNAELSFQEVKTSAYIAEALRAMPGFEIQTGIAKTGIKAVLKGGKPGPVFRKMHTLFQASKRQAA